MHRTQHLPGPAADPDETIIVTPADILRGAATYLEVHGWVQNVYYGGHADDAFPPCCADGAIGMAAYGRVPDSFIPGTGKDQPGFRDYNRARVHLAGFLHKSGYRPPCDPWCTGEDCRCVNDEPEIVFAFNDDDQTIEHDVVRMLRAAADDYERTHALDGEAVS